MIRESFVTICNNAIEADEYSGGTNCQVLEPFFRQLIDLSDPDGDNSELLECFFSIIHDEIDAPYETLPYCMRVLRYHEVGEESQKRLGDPPDPRWMNTHSDIIHALNSETWEDADLWAMIG